MYHLVDEHQSFTETGEAGRPLVTPRHGQLGRRGTDPEGAGSGPMSLSVA